MLRVLKWIGAALAVTLAHALGLIAALAYAGAAVAHEVNDTLRGDA